MVVTSKVNDLDFRMDFRMDFRIIVNCIFIIAIY